jgi:hypothetical protein
MPSVFTSTAAEACSTAGAGAAGPEPPFSTVTARTTMSATAKTGTPISNHRRRREDAAIQYSGSRGLTWTDTRPGLGSLG